MLRHSYVPEDFLLGIIKPVLKSKHGDSTSLDMYRGITITPSLSKLFERVYSRFLCSDYLQFGLNAETVVAVLCLLSLNLSDIVVNMTVKYTAPFWTLVRPSIRSNKWLD